MNAMRLRNKVKAKTTDRKGEVALLLLVIALAWWDHGRGPGSSLTRAQSATPFFSGKKSTGRVALTPRLQPV